VVNEEILGGLRNALERGYSFEMAVQSFINAGYNQNEVREAAEYISHGAMPLIHPESIPAVQMQNMGPVRTAPIMSNIPMAPAFTSIQPQIPPSADKPSFLSSIQEDKGKMILIGGIILSLLIIFGAIGYVILKYAF
jgi:hypothetical protein